MCDLISLQPVLGVAVGNLQSHVVQLVDKTAGVAEKDSGYSRFTPVPPVCGVVGLCVLC